MALLRPNLTIVLDIDERLASTKTQLEIKRCWAHVGTPVIRTHAAQPTDARPTGDAGKPLPEADAQADKADAPYANTVKLLVSLGTSKYLHSEDEGADALWNEAIGPAVSNMLHKIGSTMQSFNTRQRKIGLPEIVFTRFDVELQNGEFTVGLHPDAASGLDRPLRAQVDLARTLLNDGTLQGAVRVDAPSDAAYQQQSAQARELWDAQQAAKEAEQAAQAAQDDTPLDEQAERMRAYAQQSLEDKQLGTARFFDEEWLAADAERKSYENTAVEPVDTDELPPAFHLPEEPEPEQFNFEVDYSQWAVTFANGTVRPFDAGDMRFTDEDNRG